MDLSMGLGINAGASDGAAAVGPIYSPAALSWFDDVEAAGSAFGLNPAAVSSNKELIDEEIFQGLPADGIPLSMFYYLGLRVGPTTLPGALVSIRGLPTFSNLVAGDYNRLTGLKYGNLKATNSRVSQHTLNQDNQCVLTYATEVTDNSVVSVPALWGPSVNGGRNTATVTVATSVINTRGVRETNSPGTASSLPGLRAVSRLNEVEYLTHVAGITQVIAGASIGQVIAEISFNHFTDAVNFGTTRTAVEAISDGLTLAQLALFRTRIANVLAGLV